GEHRVDERAEARPRRTADGAWHLEHCDLRRFAFGTGGAGGRRLHDDARAGATLQSRSPRGEPIFVPPPILRPDLGRSGLADQLLLANAEARLCIESQQVWIEPDDCAAAVEVIVPGADGCVAVSAFARDGQTGWLRDERARTEGRAALDLTRCGIVPATRLP